MRATLAMVALVVTSMVAVSFLIPLGMLVRTQVEVGATTLAERRAVAVVPALTLAPQPGELAVAVSGMRPADRPCVHLPEGQVVGDSHAPQEMLARVVRERQSVSGDVPGGWAYLQPVLLDDARVAVVEEFVPQSELTRGVAGAWTVMALLAVCLVIASVLVADRLGARMVRASRGLSRASAALGAGDLAVRVEPAGPAELHEAGLAFNAMADRVAGLLASERELVADLSHRLRTPLMALTVASERIGPVPGSAQLDAAVSQLESELDSIIRAAQTPRSTRAAQPGPGVAGADPAGPDPALPQVSCRVAEVAGRRVGFWSMLAEQQGRPCTFGATDEPTRVQLPEDDLAAVVDALVGNVFRHTPQGTAFAVSVLRTAQDVVLVVEDAGPGIADPDGALSRGASTGGSTGLGLDIAHSAAGATRGRLRVLRSTRLGGARIEVVLGLASEPRRGRAASWGHRRRRALERRRQRREV
ncbi:HAMP domain-containing sensor histidine kinase [Kitasatospora sp. NPDC094015]|uniref:HAMP domain-containing sensor histidine kinase n=1 Tax=Kitasatospora sp. NPDC094015 TaxID=3155205 RepID=UPI00331A5AC3